MKTCKHFTKYAKNINAKLRSHHLRSHHLSPVKRKAHQGSLLSTFEMDDRTDCANCNYETLGSWEEEDCLDEFEQEFEIPEVDPAYTAWSERLKHLKMCA